MSRQAREKSETGIYHVMSRGINRQDIFHDKEDSERYLETLMRVKEKQDIALYGYCLMENHVHLLIKEGKDGLAAAMKSIGTAYARWYNWKYDRNGHVFQDRYKSEAVDKEAYLLTVVRYIHLNPVKAGLAKNPESWDWSSCRAYYEMSPYPLGLTETEFTLGILSENKENAISLFREYMEEANSDQCLDHDEKKRRSDGEVRQEIIRLMQGRNIQNINSMPKEERKAILRNTKAIKGTNYRQIARILGVAPSTIFKA
ncbi:REP-associated tyrosine transposase [Candidatus Formimonas warabiya]|uniref:Transposase n=1 Tax=Formimonas warabiya TaxID=1761012 RepID=A0A3G1KXW3_FORW1|nr:transposase [Candidatus Formimonas warabiya]ATW27324.1 transposase [Candidatus Formimonas warabiya]